MAAGAAASRTLHFSPSSSAPAADNADNIPTESGFRVPSSLEGPCLEGQHPDPSRSARRESRRSVRGAPRRAGRAGSGCRIDPRQGSREGRCSSVTRVGNSSWKLQFHTGRGECVPPSGGRRRVGDSTNRALMGAAGGVAARRPAGRTGPRTDPPRARSHSPRRNERVGSRAPHGGDASGMREGPSSPRAGRVPVPLWRQRRLGGPIRARPRSSAVPIDPRFVRRRAGVGPVNLAGPSAAVAGWRAGGRSARGPRGRRGSRRARQCRR